ncbi:MAG: hypothetical protein ABII09_06370 [Planctomycetota bacterium]
MGAKRQGKLFILAVLLVIMPAGIAQSKTWVDDWKQMYLTEEEKKQDSRDDLAVTFTMSGVSEYIWRGFDMFDDRGALQPSINVDWYGTGVSTMVWSAYPLTGDIKDRTEMRYIVGYTGWLWEDTLHVTQYTVNWTYYDFIQMPSTERDAEEIGLQLSWPQAYMVGDSRFVPNYYVGRLWPAKSGAVNKDSGGWIHILGMDYEFWLFGAGAERQLVCLSAEAVYNDGMLGAENAWSDLVFGIGTTWRDGPWTVRPEFKYQVSLEDTVNNEDEYWGGMSVSYKF